MKRNAAKWIKNSITDFGYESVILCVNDRELSDKDNTNLDLANSRNGMQEGAHGLFVGGGTA
jgi:hypothetical protein